MESEAGLVETKSISRKNRSGRDRLSRLLAYSLLSLAAIVVLFPMYMAFVRAVSDPITYSINRGRPLYPVDVDLGVFFQAFEEANFDRQLLVSICVTTAVTVGQLFTSTLAAYAFTFLRFPLRRLLFAACISTLMLPIEVTLLANSRTIREFEWTNSIQGLAVPFFASAFGIFLLRQGFLAIPRELREATEMDGHGHGFFLLRVAIPLARPVIAAFLLVSFLTTWSQYLWPRTITDDEKWNTVQIGLRQAAGSNPDDLNVGVAAALLAFIPVLIGLVVFQRHIVRGLTAGAVKG